jgi:hypothetical protein
VVVVEMIRVVRVVCEARAMMMGAIPMRVPVFMRMGVGMVGPELGVPVHEKSESQAGNEEAGGPTEPRVEALGNYVS